MKRGKGYGGLNIRNLPDDVHARLRIRAAKAGRSMEAEARAILTVVCAHEVPQRSLDLQEWVDSLYGAKKRGRWSNRSWPSVEERARRNDRFGCFCLSRLPLSRKGA